MQKIKLTKLRVINFLVDNYVEMYFLSFFFFRTGNIYKGIIQANEIFPDAYLIIIMIGTVKGRFNFLLSWICHSNLA